ncbi:aspartyl-tRNA(Asn)/glutamyl-tRNA(Gln) amidotransferase subunit A [Bradyrhizobium sp. GM0.4]
MNEVNWSATDPSVLPASILAQQIAAKKLSPVEVIDALLGRIEKLEPKLHAYVEVYGASSRLAAEAAHKTIWAGHAVGPLHGVPIALKDVIELEGQITTGGSAAWRQRRSVETATIVRRMIAAGMIVLGKTQTVEFGYGGWGINQHMGTPWNPWDIETARTPGGSSSGSGVAVAARMVPWAIGTDTGGSVRIPSSFCGLTGLKVTSGRISAHGVLPLSQTLDTPGPMARTVEDVAMLYNVLQGPDPSDPNTRGVLPDDPMPTLSRGVRGLRLGRMPAAEREGIADEVLEAYDRSLDVLGRLGAEIVDIALPFRFIDCLNLKAAVLAEAYFNLGYLAEDPELQLDDAVRRNLLRSAGVSAQDYLTTRQQLRDMKLKMYRSLEGVDALLTPTTETAALKLTDVDQDRPASRFARVFNVLEMCALALPNGFTTTGLPLSLQVVCRGYDEAMALRVGHAYQQGTQWHLRAPPL